MALLDRLLVKFQATGHRVLLFWCAEQALWHFDFSGPVDRVNCPPGWTAGQFQATGCRCSGAWSRIVVLVHFWVHGAGDFTLLGPVGKTMSFPELPACQLWQQGLKFVWILWVSAGFE
eukprot:1157822-Pelagomonas_calceolata.AAC.4